MRTFCSKFWIVDAISLFLIYRGGGSWTPLYQSVTVISCLWSWGFELMTYSSLVQHSFFWISNTGVQIGFWFILCVHVPSVFRRYVFIRLWEETDPRRSSIILISQWEIVQIMAAGLPSYRSHKLARDCIQRRALSVMDILFLKWPLIS